VLRATDAAGRSVLLPGDIEAPQEAALVARLGAGLRSTLLLVPHHGSKTSSTDAFLDAVQPQVAMVQAGYRSRFGHPAPEVLARYSTRGIMVVRSDRCGAWSWHDGASQCARDARRRYWHWADPALGAEVASPADAGEKRP
jgi:competence protein ComEC